MNTLREQLLALAENDADPQTLVFIAAQIALGEPQDYDTAGSCPICGPTLVNDGTCIRHGDIDVLWSAHYAGRRDAADAITALRAENERQAREIANARRTAEYWKREHLAANAAAERVEAERDALRELLREVLHATSCNMSMDMYAKVCAALDAARAKVGKP